MYLAEVDDAPPGISKKELIIPGKRWEATREGVEDYVYLSMLRDAIRDAGRSVSPESLSRAREVLADSPRKVLGNVNDARLADRAKEDILKVIIDVSPGAGS